jgi:23S rRNA (adenine2503-C2)-methyltransferase
MDISPRRITLSTSGVAGRMPDFATKAPAVNLAVSLNATTDAVRSRIMPVNRSFPIRSLMEACRRYPLKARRRITFEYVLIAGLNDSDGDAKRLASLLRGIPSKINLIPLNEFDGCALKRPADERVKEFQDMLANAGLTAMVRESRGRDILAACGQLRHGHKRAAGSGIGVAATSG